MTEQKLWAVHVDGPDTVIAQPDRDTAEARARFWTQVADLSLARLMMRHPSPYYPRIICHVIKWPYSSDLHAQDLAKHGGAPREIC